MSDAPRNGPGSEPTPTEAADLEARRRAFGSGLTDAKKRHAPPDVTERPSGAFGIAMRLTVELVSGVLVGGAIGWGLDELAGTKPFLFLLFLAIGMAAGMLNVFRSARRMQLGATEQDGKDGAGGTATSRDES